jgi:plastocyanin
MRKIQFSAFLQWFCSMAFVAARICLIVGAGSLWVADSAANAQEGVGHLRGRVELRNPVAYDSRIISKEIGAIYQKTAAVPPSTYEPLSFVIYLEDAPPAGKPAHTDSSGSPSRPSARPRLVMDQKELTFVPHVLPILVGSTVEFPNSDPVYHNVFSFSPAKTFDLGRYPTGRSKALTFDKPGIVKVYCDMHSQMNAFILVLANPYFTLSDDDGNYFLRGVPAGAYKVKAWFARLPEKTDSVTIRAGETATLDFVFP